MIGWYVNVGYFPNSSPTSLSSFTVLDSNNIVTMATGKKLEEAGMFTEHDIKDSSIIMESVLGNDFYSTYFVPSAVSSPYSTLINFESQYLPSVSNMFKNSHEYRLSTNTDIYWGIHFKSLNRLIIWNGVYAYKVFSVNGNSLSLLGSYSLYQTFYPFLITALNANNGTLSNCVLCISNYNGPSDIISENLSTYTFTFTGPVNSPRFFDITSNVISSRAKNFFNAIFGGGLPPDVSIINPDNPYEPGGPSGPTDPDLPPGTFDDSSDTIPDSPLPTISAADTGFTRIYNPTLSQVQALARYLWTTPDIIETIWNHIKQFFENPMDAIIGFNLVPVPVPDGGTTNFKLMYIDTGVAMTAAANQFVDVDCGTLEVKRYYGSALDQSPYTKVSCFLPYIGTVQLNTDEVMGATLQVKYRVDICSGSCVAKIFIDGNCIYQYSGHCAINIPISSADFSSYVSAAINVAKLAIGAATAGAGGAAMAAAQVAGSEQQTGNTMSFQPQSGSSPDLPAIYQGQSQQPSGQTTTSASFAGLSPSNISNTVGEIMNAKPHVEHSGSFSGNTGYLGVRRPFIIIERPNMCMPANYQALNGFPAMITMELGTCKGFTRVQQVQLTGMTATNPEQAEILELLKSGVVL